MGLCWWISKVPGLFSFHLGELREQEGIVGETIRHTKRGGASAMPGRRGGMAGQTNYTDETAERNMRDAVNFAAHFFSENNVRRVLIGGTDDNVALFRSMLPKSWQSLIVGTFPMSMTASADEVLARAMEIGAQAELRQETELLTENCHRGSQRAGWCAWIGRNPACAARRAACRPWSSRMAFALQDIAARAAAI